MSEIEPQLVFNMVGANLHFDFNYKIKSDPVWLHDNGTGSIQISGMNASFLMTPSIVDGTVEMDFKQLGIIEMDDY